MNDKDLRELDAFIAEHVMGWDVAAMIRQSDGIYNMVGAVPGNRHLVKYSPTTDPAAAMMVLEKCAAKLKDEDKEETVSIGLDEPYYVVEKTNCIPNLRVESPTLPLAICLFAKKLFS